MIGVLEELHEAGVLSPLDVHFAELIARLAGERDGQVALAAALVSSWRGRGHVCLDLANLQESMLIEPGEEPQAVIELPEREAWLERLRDTTVVRPDGDEQPKVPLVLDERGRLYLYRYWRFQKWLIDVIGSRTAETVADIDEAALKEGLDRLFPPEVGIDWQRVAACIAVLKRFTVISGGPGTGKTYTAARVLALLLEQDPETRIALAAPTGKAKTRLQESIQEAKKDEGFKCAAEIRTKITDQQAFTVHRLLGGRPGISRYTYHAGNRLPYDVVIVDEASMVDVALMARLVSALPDEARLILLGDKDQLASVEAGAVLGNICDSGHEHVFSKDFADRVASLSGVEVPSEAGDGTAMRDSVVILRKIRRFAGDSAIGRLAVAVNAGDPAQAMSIIREDASDRLAWVEMPAVADLKDALAPDVTAGFAPYLEAPDEAAALKAFLDFRILCAHRVGAYGSERLNVLVREILAETGKIKRHGEWYHRRPVMVTENDYNLQLFNGDIGITWVEDDQVRIYFPGDGDRPRAIRTTGMPAHETAYALTVHKSQGSEFKRVLLMLSKEISRVLTRELVYTGITRARDHVAVWGTGPVFTESVTRRIQRTSGLRDALWGGVGLSHT